MKRIITLGILSMTLCTATSCSVAMAANTSGTSITKVQGCRSRAEFVAAGGKVMTSQRLPNGDLEELFQFSKEQGSAGRALMHAVMDVWTFGLWEVIGTPIEACNSKEYFSVKVISDSLGVVKTVSLN